MVFLSISRGWDAVWTSKDQVRFTPQIEALGAKLVSILKQRGPFVALHLRYEMDMLAFSGCTQEEAEELKKMR